MLQGLPERLYLFDCHSAISYRRVIYYTAMKDNILSFHMSPKYLQIIRKLKHLQADGPFKYFSPRKRGSVMLQTSHSLLWLIAVFVGPFVAD